MKSIYSKAWLVPIPIVIVLSTTATAQPLNPDDHKAADDYVSDFGSPLNDVSRSLPWKERFDAEAVFDPRFSIESASVRTMSKPVETSAAGAGSTGDYDATGVIKHVRSSSGGLTIEHGPIERLGMPAMTMMFKVKDPAWLDEVAEGSQVRFDVENTGGGFVVTRIESDTPAAEPKTFDADGVVTQLRASAGGLTIEHGPIERLGMPGMTMMFKVKDPALLEGIEQGSKVRFNLQHGGGGMVITELEKQEAP